MNFVKPHTPEDIIKNKFIPDEVVVIFNELLCENFDGVNAVILMEQVLGCLKIKGISKEEALHRGWLNIEPLYRGFGWDVVFDKPGYNETYKSNWIFTIKGS